MLNLVCYVSRSFCPVVDTYYLGSVEELVRGRLITFLCLWASPGGQLGKTGKMVWDGGA